MNRKRNVMLLIPEMAIGGAQRSLAKLSCELAVHYEVYLVVFNLNNEVAYPIGGKLINLDVHPGPTLVSKLSAFFERIRKTKQLKRQYNIDCAISFLEGADYVNILSRSREKVVVSVRGSKIHDENMHRYFFWIRKSLLIPVLYKKATEVVTVNRGIAREMIDNFKLLPSRIRTIGNFYDVAEVSMLSHEEKDQRWSGLYLRPVLVVTGRVSREKGISGIIRVFAKLRDKHPDVLLMIVGNGPDMERVLSTAEREGLRIGTDRHTPESPDVVFTGIQTNVFKYLRNAVAYLMNSSSEGFPNGLVEAMICEVPVVSSDCPYGPAELLNPDLPDYTVRDEPARTLYGYLLPRAETEHTIDLWVNCISCLLADKNARDEVASNAFRRALSFDKESVIGQWRSVIETLEAGR